MVGGGGLTEKDAIERLRSRLKNCRNILHDGGYYYVRHIDAVLEVTSEFEVDYDIA